MDELKEKRFLTSSMYGWAGYGPESLHKRMDDLDYTFNKIHEQVSFDAVAFSGSSGMIAGSLLCVKNDLPMIYVRKDDEDTHGCEVEVNSGYVHIHKYVIVDDFISSGTTICRILNKIHNKAKKNDSVIPECVGIFLYIPNYITGQVRTFKTEEGFVKLPIWGIDTFRDSITEM